MRRSANRDRVEEIDETVKAIRKTINEKIREENALLSERQTLTGMQRKTGRGPKEKGKAFEREIVASILAAFPQLSPNDVLARSMGDPGVDIILSEAARKVLPLAIECKRVGRVGDLDLEGAMVQAEANCDSKLLAPVVVFREDRHQIYATIDFGHLVTLAEYEMVGKTEILVTLAWTDLLKLLGGFKG